MYKVWQTLSNSQSCVNTNVCILYFEIVEYIIYTTINVSNVQNIKLISNINMRYEHICDEWFLFSKTWLRKDQKSPYDSAQIFFIFTKTVTPCKITQHKCVHISYISY